MSSTVKVSKVYCDVNKSSLPMQKQTWLLLDVNYTDTWWFTSILNQHMSGTEECSVYVENMILWYCCNPNLPGW